MYYDSDSQFEHLKELANSPELKADIEKIIDKHNFVQKDVITPTDKAWGNLQAIHSDLRKDLIALAKAHKTTYDTVITYMSLDKKITPKFSYWYHSDFEEGFHFDNNGDNFILRGSSVKKAFDCMFQPAIEFLLEHIDSLPESTKKYVLKRNKEAGDKDKIKLKVINNDFEAKLLSQSFPKIPDVAFLKKYFDFLKNEFKSRILNGSVCFVFFAKAIDMKYAEHNDEALNKLQKSVYIAIEKEFKSLFDGWRYGDRFIDDLSKTFDQILLNEKLADFFFTRLSQNGKNSLLGLFFSKYAKNELQKEASEKILTATLRSEMNNNTIKYDELPIEIQKYFYDEFCKRDYGINFDKMNEKLKHFKP